MDDSIFTKIINGEVPSYRIYEDERVVAFLDINPIQYGQTLVVPRVQVDHLEDLEDDDYIALMLATRRLMLHIRDELQVERVCIQVEGFDVPHVHIKLIPCNEAADFHERSYEATSDELAELATRLFY